MNVTLGHVVRKMSVLHEMHCVFEQLSYAGQKHDQEGYHDAVATTTPHDGQSTIAELDLSNRSSKCFSDLRARS